MAVWGDRKKKESTREMNISGASKGIEFKISAPEAKSVYVAGSFNDWNTKALPWKRSRDGIWRVAVDLPTGRYEYKHFIDGAWAKDTPCAETVPNAFGTSNCAIVIPK